MRTLYSLLILGAWAGMLTNAWVAIFTETAFEESSQGNDRGKKPDPATELRLKRWIPLTVCGHWRSFEQTKKLKTSSEFSLYPIYPQLFLLLLSSFEALKMPEKMVEVTKELVPCRNIQKADCVKIRRDKLNE
ncbi:hypothetical protein HID58_060019 [Brassica napus]|uniref:Uncharacterized protein n=1 Tax=Brassica napus TaxID=3708 RepID=A0ABQ7ZUQ6_BRANA|nr:hypothetical protein HID58_060019 [Brassica napus]